MARADLRPNAAIPWAPFLGLEDGLEFTGYARKRCKFEPSLALKNWGDTVLL